MPRAKLPIQPNTLCTIVDNIADHSFKIGEEVIIESAEHQDGQYIVSRVSGDVRYRVYPSDIKVVELSLDRYKTQLETAKAKVAELEEIVKFMTDNNLSVLNIKEFRVWQVLTLLKDDKKSLLEQARLIYEIVDQDAGLINPSA